MLPAEASFVSAASDRFFPEAKDFRRDMSLATPVNFVVPFL